MSSSISPPCSNSSQFMLVDFHFENSAWIEEMDRVLNSPHSNLQKETVEVLLTGAPLSAECTSWAVLRLVAHKDPELVKILLETVSIPTNDLGKAVQMAAKKEDVPILQLLLKHDAIPAEALAKAEETGHPEILECLKNALVLIE